MQNHLEKMYPACFLCDNNCSTGSAIIQLVIPSFLRKQLLMGTTFDNMSLFQNHDTVTVADSGKTVGDNKKSFCLPSAYPCHPEPASRYGYQWNW